MRFGIGVNSEHTLEEVGKFFNLTRERIRQIEIKALKKIASSCPEQDAAGICCEHYYFQWSETKGANKYSRPLFFRSDFYDHRTMTFMAISQLVHRVGSSVVGARNELDVGDGCARLSSREG